MAVVTDKITPVFTKDLSSMVGKMDEFKKLLEEKAEDILEHAAPFELDELASLYEDVPNLNLDPFEVDSENLSAEEHWFDEALKRESEMLGFFEVEGFPCLGFNLGGDWECAVYAVLVSDGTKIYSYIPLKGNCYNPDYTSAFGNHDDGEDGDGVQVDFDMIKEDICTSFKIPVGVTIETEDAISEISDSIDELVDAVEALTDDETGDFVRNSLSDILEKVKDAIKGASKNSSKTEVELNKAKTKISDLEIEVDDLSKSLKDTNSQLLDANAELAKYKAGLVASSSAEADAFRDIAKIVAAVSGGASYSVGGTPTPTAPITPAAVPKPLKKITLPSKTISFEYVYGVEMDGATAILHIIKKDDWATSELTKEGRVDVDTINRLKAEVPLKRDKFIYILNDTYSNVEEVVDAISKVKGINLEHSADVQAKF